MATTSLSFRLGEAAGTVVRECMQSMRTAQSQAVEAAQSAAPTPACVSWSCQSQSCRLKNSRGWITPRRWSGCVA